MGSSEAGAGWTNWSGNQAARPARLAEPDSLDALRALVTDGPAPLRVAGAGHSFTPIVATDGTLVRLDRMSGVISVDKEACRARVHAGTRLHDLSPALEAHGMAMPNLGDIDAQSLAGAVSTATHGTGAGFPCLSAQLRSVTLMLADGSLREATREDDPDLLRAAQVSLGALGVVVEAELDLVPAFRLHRGVWSAPIEQILDEAPERWVRHRNFEFFYIPFSGHGICIAHDATEAAPTDREESDDDAAVMGLKFIRDGCGADLAARRARLSEALAADPGEDVVGIGWQLLASRRGVPFNEMEYHLPPDGALDAFQETVRYVERERPDVFFPIEVRMTAGDDAWLSPFQEGARISIAIHAFAEDDASWMAAGAEPIFRAAGGRPHWGKLHSLGAADLRGLYPDFDRFCALRRELDPDGRFLTPALAKLWGENV